MFESLEIRTLLNATLDGFGVLNVAGSTRNDIVTISASGANIVVAIQPENFNQAFPASAVAGILVEADAGNDLVHVDQSITRPATLLGGAGNDVLSGGAGNDLINGQAGNDLMNGGLGGDGMIGETGIDTVDYRSRTGDLNISLQHLAPAADDGESAEHDDIDLTVDVVLCGSGNDSVTTQSTLDTRIFYGNGGNDTLQGGDAADRLNGGPGNDSLLGGGGNDVMIGAGGSDVFRGGAGSDTVSYYYALTRVVVDIDGNSDDGTLNEQDNVQTDCENVVGGFGNDRIVGNTLSSAANRLHGGPGNDQLEGRNGHDVLSGGFGNDTLVGGHGNDRMFGGPGADRLLGGRGNDVLDGGLGRDALFGQIGTDTIVANDGQSDFISNDATDQVLRDEIDDVAIT